MENDTSAVDSWLECYVDELYIYVCAMMKVGKVLCKEFMINVFFKS